MIPKISHQVWVGEKDFPEQEHAWRQTLVEHHPGWLHYMWTDQGWGTHVDVLGPDCADLLSHCRTLSEKSDVIRWFALHKMGGVYLDTDMEIYKPLDPLSIGHGAWVGNFENEGHLGALPTVVATTPGHPLTNFCIGHLWDRKDLDGSSGFRFGAVLPISLDHPDYPILDAPVHIYPTWVLYPYRGHEKKWPTDFQDRRATGAYAAHHWQGSWVEEEAT